MTEHVEEEITAELLPPTFDQQEDQDAETGEKDSRTPDRNLNVVIPTIVAQVAFGSFPTSSLPDGIPPSPQSDQAERYVQFTAPILELIDFHECLGGMEEISRTGRLIIGGLVLVGGVVAMKLPERTQRKKQEKEKEDEEDQSAN